MGSGNTGTLVVPLPVVCVLALGAAPVLAGCDRAVDPEPLLARDAHRGGRDAGRNSEAGAGDGPSDARASEGRPDGSRPSTGEERPDSDVGAGGDDGGLSDGGGGDNRRDSAQPDIPGGHVPPARWPPTRFDCPEPDPTDNVLYVSSHSGGDGNGTIARPFQTIGAALSTALSSHGDGTVIRVAAGQYTETVAMEFPPHSVHFCGGYKPDDFSARDPSQHVSTITSGSGPAFLLKHAYRTSISGFHITGSQGGIVDSSYNGGDDGHYLTIANNVVDSVSGPAIRIASGIISANVVSNSTAATAPGVSVFLASGSAAEHSIIEHNEISNNVATVNHGGAIVIGVEAADTIVRGNLLKGNVMTASYGGAVYHLAKGGQFHDNIYIANVSGGHSPFFIDGGEAVLTRETFIDGPCGANGGGAVAIDGGVRPNELGERVAVSGIAVIQNSVFFNNGCPGTVGSGVLLRTRAAVKVINCIFDNRGSDLGGNPGSDGATLEVATSYYGSIEPGQATVVATEGNIIGEDPLFADPQGHDFHLRSNAGRWNPVFEEWVRDDVTSDAVGAGIDPMGQAINMGLYGGTAEASRVP